MAKLSSFKQDGGKAEEGVWVTGVLGDIDVKVARAMNPRFLKKFRDLTKTYRNLKSISDDVSARIVNECLAETILLDWRHVQDDDGVDMAYSSGAALKVLSDAENAEFRKIVQDLSEENELFRKEVVEEIATKS